MTHNCKNGKREATFKATCGATFKATFGATFGVATTRIYIGNNTRGIYILNIVNTLPHYYLNYYSFTQSRIPNLFATENNHSPHGYKSIKSVTAINKQPRRIQQKTRGVAIIGRSSL